MVEYIPPSKEDWSGRISGELLYLHEKVKCQSVDELSSLNNSFALLGYCCDEGVRRNQGRVGSINGPEAIRVALGKMPNHLDNKTHFFDVGDVVCSNQNMEKAQNLLSQKTAFLLKQGSFPILLGGGHDMAYGHFNGVKQHLGNNKKIGIINFDAHFDLRDNAKGNNSGTPFYQIAQENSEFHYLCLGIRKDANDQSLFGTAKRLDVDYVMRDKFCTRFQNEINAQLNAFINKVDKVYVTIDLDGFSSAYTPGVSAPSPMGFSPDVVLESLTTILQTGKLISLDIAEMNPKYDLDGQTAKLAASLVHYVLHHYS
ncbi:formimidoylglutamase [Allomuricauda sp. d1]|uniref:formimidoylglutamase n=1 Tax=Allomuricauda sp. d1 TaxID=3136725 RepID=UPI0031D3F404